MNLYQKTVFLGLSAIVFSAPLAYAQAKNNVDSPQRPSQYILDEVKTLNKAASLDVCKAKFAAYASNYNKVRGLKNSKVPFTPTFKTLSGEHLFDYKLDNSKNSIVATTSTIQTTENNALVIVNVNSFAVGNRTEGFNGITITTNCAARYHVVYDK